MPELDPSLESKPKRKPGRPKGAAQQNFLTLRYWFEVIRTEHEHLKPYQRAIIAAKMMQTLLSHDKHMKSDPNKRDRNKPDEVDEDTLIASLSPESNLNKS